MKREYGDYIQDIIDSIKETEEFTKELSFDDFKQDKKTVNAVIRSLEIMGEAAKKIPDDLRRKFSRATILRNIENCEGVAECNGAES